MSVKETRNKRLCAALTEGDHARLAKESCRTPPRYIRWVLHQHFTALDKASSDSRPSP